MSRRVRKSVEPLWRRVSRLKARPCLRGHTRLDAFVEVDHRTGGVRIRCRTCHRERLRRYHAEGRVYRY